MVTQKIVFTWLALLLACSPLGIYALDSKPHIVVGFEIKVPAFERNLPQRAAAQETIARELAKQLAQRFAFADWTIVPRDDQARLGSLLLRLEEEPNTVPNPRIAVRWYGSVGISSVAAKEISIPAVEVYEPTNPNWDTNSRRNFETRVMDKLAAAMRTDAFYDVLFKNFVRNLPISTSVTAQASDRAIDVPMRWREMQLAPESVLVVRFSKQVGATAETGSLRLNPVAARIVVLDTATNTTTTLLRGGVDTATLGVQKINLVNNWSDRLPELLRGAEVRTYIVDYKPVEFVGTGDGLVLDPTE